MADKFMATVVDFRKSKIPATCHGMVGGMFSGEFHELRGMPGRLEIDFP